MKLNTANSKSTVQAKSKQNHRQSCLCTLLLVSSFSILSGCSTYPTWIPSSGPSTEQIQNASTTASGAGIQIIDVSDSVARKLLASQRLSLFSEVFGQKAQSGYFVGAGDVIEVSVWEAPPASLFASGSVDPRSAPSTTRVTALPEQMVNSDGAINIPFVGQIMASGRSPQQIETDIVQRLKGKANQPQVLVRVIKNNTANVTVVGEVTSSTRMPLTARGERLLDALAAAGGVRQPVGKMTLQVTRGDRVQALPLDTIIRDPRQNIVLQPGDVVTSLFQPLSFTVLGATGRNEEVNFEAQGISLAQALARSGGLQDARADAQGVFIFRLESPAAMDLGPNTPATTPEGLVPVIYKVNLKDPATFFVAQSFPVQNKDVLFVSNAPAAELQKFLNILVSAIFPVANIVSVTR
jgi:polysaccharide export outer membrane protein